MDILITGLVLFLGMHSISIVNASWRDRMVTKLGLLAWQGPYSLLAIAGFVLIIHGYQLASESPVILYEPPVWLHHVSLLLMVFVFPLFFATYLPGRIQTVAKHPTLVATKTWALAHLLANGSLADVVLFGAFLAWAVVDRISIKRRIPIAVSGVPASKLNDVLVIVLGLGVYVLFVLWAHAWLFGVSPI